MTSSERMNGGEAMIRAAAANGIDTVFGLPGAQIYPLFDALYRHPEIRTIISRHEQGAAYMAMGYAKATGRPGAFAVVPGPGVLNTTAALCTAAGCNTPVICLTGQIMSGFLGKGRGHLHELSDQAGTLRTLIKHADRIDDPARTSEQMNAAFRIMQSGRPGPVSVEMCWDTMAGEWDVAIAAGNDVIDRPAIDADAVARAADLVAGARNVMIMCGGGAQHASAEVRELAEMLGAASTAFRSGRGVVSEDSDCGVSSAAAMRLWRDTDLLIGIGSRLEMQYMRWLSMAEYYDRPPENGPKLIRIDIDPNEMTRFMPHVGIVADAAEGVRALVDAVARKQFRKGDPDRIARAKAGARAAYEEVQPEIAYLDTIRDVLPRDGYFVEELCQAGFASYFGFPVYEPRTYVTPGYQGTLGFGFPTAIGVKAAMPDRAVVSISGGGGFLFGMPELAAAVQHGIGLVTVLFNNRSFGNVRRDQQEKFGSRLIGADLDNPDFVQVARAFGADACRVSSPAELRPALASAIDADRPAVIEVQIERGSEVSPWKYILR
ncbi:MAG: thiamine pyrophosphate-binding protein [Gammaproteobacteria bacterium]|nr:thiamine pyrophosphate-binding protein [Gammaproteobacteria bacterium]